VEKDEEYLETSKFRFEQRGPGAPGAQPAPVESNGSPAKRLGRKPKARADQPDLFGNDEPAS
jgi:hypothetical protein